MYNNNLVYHTIFINWKSINKFAVIVILMIAIPEIAGHALFDKSHPQDSSVTAAVSFVNNLRDNAQKSGICYLSIQSDQSDSHIARVTGLESKYGNFTCSQWA